MKKGERARPGAAEMARRGKGGDQNADGGQPAVESVTVCDFGAAGCSRCCTVRQEQTQEARAAGLAALREAAAEILWGREG